MNINPSYTAVSPSDNGTQAVIKKVTDKLTANGMSLAHGKDDMEFIILNSNKFTYEVITSLFEHHVFRIWCPVLQKRTTEDGNHIITLKSLEVPNFLDPFTGRLRAIPLTGAVWPWTLVPGEEVGNIHGKTWRVPEDIARQPHRGHER